MAKFKGGIKMGIEEDIKDIRASLLVIKETLCLTYGLEPGNNEVEIEETPKETPEEKEIISDKKDIDTKKAEIEDPIFYECTRCGVSFARGEEHICKTERKK